MYDFIIVGKGMIGASSARYLAESGAAVAVIGPDEPQGDWSTHAGVFGSHYDQRRISRRLDSDWIWARLAERSISQYADIKSVVVSNSTIRLAASLRVASGGAPGLTRGGFLTIR